MERCSHAQHLKAVMTLRNLRFPNECSLMKSPFRGCSDVGHMKPPDALAESGSDGDRVLTFQYWYEYLNNSSGSRKMLQRAF